MKIEVFCVCAFPSTSSEPYEIVGAVVVKVLVIGGSRYEPVVRVAMILVGLMPEGYSWVWGMPWTYFEGF